MQCHQSQESNFLEAVSRPGILGAGLAARRLSASHEVLSLAGAKTNRQNQLLDLEKVPENPAEGDGWGVGMRVKAELS